MPVTKILAADAAEKLKSDIATDIEKKKATGISPRLVSIGATDDESVLSYERSKEKNAASLGIQYEFINLPKGADQSTLNDTIKRAASDKTVHGVCLSLPLFNGLDAEEALDHIPAAKDVDGLGAENLGLIACGREDRAIIAATPQACIMMAEMTGQSLKGKNVCVMGRGRTVGKILTQLLINRDATVTVCHSRTQDPKNHTRSADIVFCAIGRGRMLNRDYFTNGQIVVDAGINYVDGKLCGDVDAQSVEDMDISLTPVPGGVGKMTTLLIFKNLLKGMELQS